MSSGEETNMIYEGLDIISEEETEIKHFADLFGGVFKQISEQKFTEITSVYYHKAIELDRLMYMHVVPSN